MNIGKIDVMLILLSGFILFLPALSGLYFAVVFLRSPFRRVKPLPAGIPMTRFAMIVPACNEERVIQRALDSLLRLDYPGNRMDIFVIADNCTDATAKVASSCGVHVMERFDPVRRSKQDALRWAFYDQGLLEAGYDAICIIDADTTVSPSFLRHVERRISEGHAVVAGWRRTINPFDTFASSFSAILTMAGNRFSELPLVNRGISILNYGTGVAIRCDHLRKIGWTVNTLVEDMEFALQTILSGQKVMLCPEAVYEAEQPADIAALWQQQRRWQSGSLSCGFLFLGKITVRFLREKDASALMGFVKLLLPYTFIAGLFQIVLGPILSIALYGPGIFTPLSVLAGLLVAQLAGMVSAMGILLIDGSFSRKMWKGILCFSLYPVFFGMVSLVSLLWPKRNWVLIEHGLSRNRKSFLRSSSSEV